MFSSRIRNFIWNFLEIYLFFSLFTIYDINLFFSANLCYITYALSEQQKINSGFFLFEAEQKAKKAKKNISDTRRLQQTKIYECIVSSQNILAAHSSDESDFLDEKL